MKSDITVAAPLHPVFVPPLLRFEIARDRRQGSSLRNGQSERRDTFSFARLVDDSQKIRPTTTATKLANLEDPVPDEEARPVHRPKDCPLQAVVELGEPVP